jgi:hypothetical protein
MTDLAALPLKLRRRKCKACPFRFAPQRPAQLACSPECAEIMAAAERRKQEKVKDRERAEALKSLRELANEAQAAFNDYIRARDAREKCICCAKPFEPQKPGGAIDAGHFLSREDAPHLRFDENNCFAQRKNCNRPGGTTKAAFRAGVIARIGLPEVLRLEGTTGPRKWSREELIDLKALYRQKRRALVAAAVTEGVPA